MPMQRRRSSRRSWSISRRPARPRLKGRPMSDLQSQDYIRRSASTLTPPSVRRHEQEVAKLIDVSRCIGCKACQAACLEWNDERIPVGENVGVYDNPPDLTPNMFTVMR